MTAKHNILTRVRTALGSQGEAAGRREVVEARLSGAPRGIVPQRGQLPRNERIDLFRAQAESVNATVETVGDYSELPHSVSRYLRERNLPAAIRMGDDARLGAADWLSERTLEILKGPTDGSDMAGLSHAFAAVAETGTLALTAGGDNPTTLNFLPEYHIVVIHADDVEGDMESIWDRVRTRFGKGEMSRVVNFVTGPSRSGDIEQKILLGAHGPRALHIVVVDPAKDR
ncbi:LutC/YkgG family protein [Pararhizobium haloflavum]|uniref:LutC/YkgG family protein n=1 Tax=Pararhizobium haloflavum TaxID=2037914 RepID=UPI000C18DC21|nr:lactate utilization protein [Pararhizobium haloflavum]